MIPGRGAPARTLSQASVRASSHAAGPHGLRQPCIAAGLAALAVLGPLAVPMLAPIAALAQQVEGSPLPLLTFSFAPRIEAETGATDALRSATALGLGFVDATPNQTLSLGARGTLRLGGGEEDDGSGEEPGFDGPIFDFGFERRAAASGLTVDGTFRRDDVDDLADLSDFVNDDGVVELPEDFNDLEGTGRRREASLDAALSLLEDAPLGVTLSAGVRDLTYEDTSSEDLQDSRRLSLGMGLRLAFGAGRSGSVDLRYSSLDEEADGVSETAGLTLGVAAERARGPVSASLSVDESEDGPRSALTLGRTLTFPVGSLTGSLGVARDSEGDLLPTGSLDLRRESPRGDLTFSLAQAVRSDDDDDEEVATTLSARLGRALTPRAGLSLDALFASANPTNEEATTSEVELGASVSFSLTRAWNLDSGVRGSLEDDGDGTERGATVFLGLSRSFATTF